MSKGLELFQELRKSLNKELNVSSVANDKLEIVEKELKALDIIKKIVKYDIEVNGNQDIPKYEPNGVITKQEYDLLKEVLL